MLMIFNNLPLQLDTISLTKFNPPKNNQEERSQIIKDEIVY